MIPTVVEGGEGAQFDVDGDPTRGCAAAPDGIPNYLDTDSDGDAADPGDTGRNGPDGTGVGRQGYADIDQDGIPDVLDCDDLDGASGDPDLDGLSTLQERKLGSDPTSSDSDGDGMSDGVEVGDVRFPLNTDDDLVWTDVDGGGDLEGGL